MTLKNGDKVIFHTDPEAIATVVGDLRTLDGCYALLFGDSVAESAVKKMTVEQYEQARKDGLIRKEGEPQKKASPPKKKVVSKKKTKVRPPWARS